MLILIEAEITIDTDAEGAVVIADNGLGIPKEAQAKIFHCSSESIGKEGSGIGLALCAKIMQSIMDVSLYGDGHSGTSFQQLLAKEFKANSADQKLR